MAQRRAWQAVRTLLSLAEVSACQPHPTSGIACFQGVAVLVERQLHTLAGSAGAASRLMARRLNLGEE
jgi:hypothetical protein